MVKIIAKFSQGVSRYNFEVVGDWRKEKVWHFYFQSVGAALIHALEKKLGANFTGKTKE